MSLTMLVVMRKWLASLGRKWSCRASRSAPSLEVRGHTEVRVPMEVRTANGDEHETDNNTGINTVAGNSCEEAGAIYVPTSV